MLYAGALGLIGVGIVYLLFGRKLIKIIIFIAGFLIFFFICFIILAGDKLRSTGSFNQNDIWMPLLVSILVGIGGGFIARCCVKLAVFLLGFAFGALVMFLVGAQVLKLGVKFSSSKI